MPTNKWRRGLLLLPIIFLGSLSAMLTYRLLPHWVDHLDAKSTATLQEMIEATEQKDMDEFYLARDRHRQVMSQIEWLSTLVLLLNSVVWANLLAFVWATWLVTSGGDDRMSRYARLASLVIPFVVLASLVPEGRSTASSLSKVCGFIIWFGHDRAYRRIAKVTGQLETGRSIQTLFRWMFIGIGIFAGLAILVIGIGQRQLLKQLALILFVGGLIVIIQLSLLLWRLRAGISTKKN